MTTHLYFDTETSDYHTETGPSLPVEIAAVLEQTGGGQDDRILTVFSAIIRQDGWTGIRINPIAERMIEKHGVTLGLASEHGIAPEVVLNLFRRMLERADVAVGHNVPFDVSVMNWAFSLQRLPALSWPQMFDTMRESATLVGIPSGGRYSIGGFKAPKLTEAYHHFTKKDLQRAHSALADVYATRAVHRGILRKREETT